MSMMMMMVMMINVMNELEGVNFSFCDTLDGDVSN